MYYCISHLLLHLACIIALTPLSSAYADPLNDVLRAMTLGILKACSHLDTRQNRSHVSHRRQVHLKTWSMRSIESDATISEFWTNVQISRHTQSFCWGFLSTTTRLIKSKITSTALQTNWGRHFPGSMAAFGVRSIIRMDPNPAEHIMLT